MNELSAARVSRRNSAAQTALTLLPTQRIRQQAAEFRLDRAVALAGAGLQPGVIEDRNVAAPVADVALVLQPARL